MKIAIIVNVTRNLPLDGRTSLNSNMEGSEESAAVGYVLNELMKTLEKIYHAKLKHQCDSPDCSEMSNCLNSYPSSYSNLWLPYSVDSGCSYCHCHPSYSSWYTLANYY
jgi:hypothetical protein